MSLHGGDHPISYLDALIRTGSENIEATLRKRRILFAGFVARMEDTRLPKCVMLGELVGGAGCAGGVRKRVDGVFPGRPQSFRHQRRPADYDHIMTAAQEKWKWRKTAEQGAERFMAKWIAAKKVRPGLRHAVV